MKFKLADDFDTEENIERDGIPNGEASKVICAPVNSNMSKHTSQRLMDQLFDKTVTLNESFKIEQTEFRVVSFKPSYYHTVSITPNTEVKIITIDDIKPPVFFNVKKLLPQQFRFLNYQYKEENHPVFEVTKKHLQLLRNFTYQSYILQLHIEDRDENWRFATNMFAGLGIRPFTQQRVYYSLWQLIQLTRLLEELKIVLKITITTGKLETGVYEYIRHFPNSSWGYWKRINIRK